MDKISEEISEIVKDKVNKVNIKSVDVIKIEDYEISFDARNWVVSKNKDSSDNTYHISLSTALINLSNRLLKDRLKVECKDKILELNDLIRVINEHHVYIINFVRGL